MYQGTYYRASAKDNQTHRRVTPLDDGKVEGRGGARVSKEDINPKTFAKV